MILTKYLATNEKQQKTIKNTNCGDVLGRFGATTDHRIPDWVSGGHVFGRIAADIATQDQNCDHQTRGSGDQKYN
ncbi:unnamed protein product [Medioppia subpectinata]|uniref:Uncharacterized protein n=1 Tax=Medioppia subpectinata TaxID=1979941 RepID=A0A7R9KT37_9ACAR|nr:unnamed protein product [Medioppia subpectinata]CAG2107940.1 unnamed protein product [Medioppia subpectinata]